MNQKMKINPTHFQPEVWQRITKILTSNRVGSAYLFSGPEGAGKEAIALAFSAALNCQGSEIVCGKCSSCIRFATLQHEHLHVVVPLPRKKTSFDKDTDVLTIIGNDNASLLTDLLQKKGTDLFQKIKLPRAKRILINSIRELRKKLYLKSVDYGYKTVLIFDAHYLSDGDGASANALLKILEEPPEKTVLILVTDHKSMLLSTIQSRCQQIDFPPLNQNIVSAYLIERGIGSKESEFYAHLSDGNIHKARFLSERPIDDILKIMKDQIESVVNPNGNDWRAYINNMSRKVRSNPEEFNFELFLLQTWFQQSYRLRQNIDAPLAQNGFAEALKLFSTSYPHANLTAVNSVIETTIESVNRNFYMPLTLTNMLLDIQRYLKGKA